MWTDVEADDVVVDPLPLNEFVFDSDQHLFPSAAGNNVEVDESLFQDIDDLDLDEDDPDFDPLEMGSDED